MCRRTLKYLLGVAIFWVVTWVLIPMHWEREPFSPGKPSLALVWLKSQKTLAFQGIVPQKSWNLEVGCRIKKKKKKKKKNKTNTAVHC